MRTYRVLVMGGILIMNLSAAVGAAPEELARGGEGQAGQAAALPFTMSITSATPKTLPEYLDNIHAVTKDLSLYQDWPFPTVVIDGEFWVIQKCGYSGTVLRYKGTNIENAVRQPDGRLLNSPKEVTAPYMLGGMWYDTSEKKLYKNVTSVNDSATWDPVVTFVRK